MITRTLNIGSELDQLLPPGPTSSPWEQAKAWIERPIEFWTECHQTFGDTITIQLGSLGPTVLFCDPESIQQIFALPSTSFECRSFNDHYRLIMGRKSLLNLDGDEHWRQRHLISPAFHSANLSGWINSARSQTQKHIVPLRHGATIHVRRLIHEISFGIILDLLFDEQQVAIRSFLQQLFLEYIVRDYGTWSPWARFVKSHEALRILLGAEIRRYRNPRLDRPTNDRLFGRLVRPQITEDTPADDQIEDHIFTMLIAGVDPSAISATWFIYWIHQNPRVLGRLRDEIDSVEDLNAYVQNEEAYLHQVCLESMRMYPVVTTPSGRKLLVTTEIGGRLFPQGVTLLPCTYLAHRREQAFPKPDEFIPERFAARSYKQGEYFPFGGGRRLCIGSRWAPISLKVIIVELLRNLEMRAATDGDVVPIRHGTLLAPSDNFRLQIDKRLDPSMERVANV